MNINIGNIIKGMLANVSHLHTIFELITDAFSTGTIRKKGEDPQSQFSKMLDEGIEANIATLVKEKLSGKGYTADEIKSIFKESGEWFFHHRQFIPAFRQHLAVITDLQAQVRIMLDFVLGDDDHRIQACQMLDQRHPLARVLLEKFVETKQVWNHTLLSLPQEQAHKLREFVDFLPDPQKIQFVSSIGALQLQSERAAVLNEIFEGKEKEAMRGIALDRGLIKPEQAASASLQAAKSIVQWYIKLFTPDPVNPAELAQAKADCDAEWGKLGNTVNKNPFLRIGKKMFS